MHYSTLKVNLLPCRKNEELDDKAVIKKLKLKIEELQTEIFLLRQGSSSSVSQQVNNSYLTTKANSCAW